MKRIISFIILFAILILNTAYATSDFNMDIFHNQSTILINNPIVKQYTIDIDDMEARGFITLNTHYSVTDSSFVYTRHDRAYYACEPDLYLSKYGTSSFYPVPRIWFYYLGDNPYAYETAIFKIGETTYTFNDIYVSYDITNSDDWILKTSSVCMCDTKYIDFMDAWIENGTLPIKVRLKGKNDSIDFQFPENSQKSTLLLFQNFKEAGGYDLLPTY